MIVLKPLEKGLLTLPFDTLFLHFVYNQQELNKNKSTCLQAVCRMKSCNINGLQMGIWLAMNRRSVVANWQPILFHNSRGFVFGRSTYKDSIH